MSESRERPFEKKLVRLICHFFGHALTMHVDIKGRIALYDTLNSEWRYTEKGFLPTTGKE